MQLFLSNVFNDPSDPWYYVIGILFLALIFGALALYIVLDNKRKKRDGDDTGAKTPPDAINTPADTETDAAQTSEITENTDNNSKLTEKNKK